jgi:hypothetical protein
MTPFAQIMLGIGTAILGTLAVLAGWCAIEGRARRHWWKLMDWMER